MGVEQLEMELEKLIEDCIGLHVGGRLENLLDMDGETVTVDWLYVFIEIEERYHVNLGQIIAEGDYNSFTMHGLAERVIEEIEGFQT